MSDIRFYDFDLNLAYILPAHSKGKGYVATVATQEFNDAGALEILFVDDTLKKLVRERRGSMLVTWNGFQGFTTSYQFDKECRLMGMSLNGLLNRIVVPETGEVVTGDVYSLASAAITSEIAPWLNVMPATDEFINEVEYSTDKYKTADTYLQELLKLDNAGYRVYADFAEKKFCLEVLKSKETNLMLSSGNLNAYEIVENFSDKKIAVGGWYKKKSDDGASATWEYITTDESVSGVKKIDTVLSSTTETEARNELKNKVYESSFDLKTRRIKYGVDYMLGDVVRVQNEGITMKKRISGITLSQENRYEENPILSEV